MALIDPDFNQYWCHRDSFYGLCMTDQNGLTYVNIPKNASSFLKEKFSKLGWTFGNYHDVVSENNIVILRDPIDRWVSGITQYFSMYHRSWTWLTKEAVSLVFDTIVFDDHTEKQVYFLKGLDTDRCTFIRFGPNLEVTLASLLGRYSITYTDAQKVQSLGVESTIRSQIKEILKTDQQKLSKVRDFYKQDYDLVQKVTFYEI